MGFDHFWPVKENQEILFVVCFNFTLINKIPIYPFPTHQQLPISSVKLCSLLYLLMKSNMPGKVNFKTFSMLQNDDFKS